MSNHIEVKKTIDPTNKDRIIKKYTVSDGKINFTLETDNHKSFQPKKLFNVVLFRLKSEDDKLDIYSSYDSAPPGKNLKHHKSFTDCYFEPLIKKIIYNKKYSWRVFYDDSIICDAWCKGEFCVLKKYKYVQLVHYDFPQFKDTDNSTPKLFDASNGGYHVGLFGTVVRFLTFFQIGDLNKGIIASYTTDADETFIFYDVFEKFIKNKKCNFSFVSHWCYAYYSAVITYKHDYLPLAGTTFSKTEFPLEVFTKFLTKLLYNQDDFIGKIITGVNKKLECSNAFIRGPMKAITNKDNYVKGAFYGFDEYFLSVVVLNYIKTNRISYCITMDEFNDTKVLLSIIKRFFNETNRFNKEPEVGKKFMKKFLGKYFRNKIPIHSQLIYHHGWMNMMSQHLQQVSYGAQNDNFNKKRVMGNVQSRSTESLVDESAVEKYRYLRDNLINSMKIVVENQHIVDTYTIFKNSYVCATFPGRLAKMGKVLWTPNGELTPFEYFETIKGDKRITKLYKKSTSRCIADKIK